MKYRIGLLLLVLVPILAQAQEVRELGRARVTDLSTGDYHDSAVLGDRPGVYFAGKMITYGAPIDRIEYDANFTVGGQTYNISDDADTLWWTRNGAQYQMWSRYTDEEYPVVFLRRAPDYQIVTIEGEQWYVPNYDRATIVRIQDGNLVYDLDYRGIE